MLGARFSGGAIVAAIVTTLLAPTAWRLADPASATEPRRVAGRGSLAADEAATIALFQESSPAVVFITSINVERDFFSLRALQVPSGTGTGFVWDERGHVVTNFHVVARADAFQVTLSDRSSWDARLVGAAPRKDLAVLRLEAPSDRLRPIALGTSADLQVGQKVYAIGNPFGLDQTLTTGVISALGREIDSMAGYPIREVVQTDAAINPGNSGGPLLDSAGRLIGVNTQIVSPSGAYAGIGFAIPVDTVNWVVPELIDKGRIERPTLGITMYPADRIRGLEVEGALIVEVARGSGAERAGLRGTRRDRFGRIAVGDVVVEVDGKQVRSTDDLALALERRAAGDEVEIVVMRDSELLTLTVELGPSSS